MRDPIREFLESNFIQRVIKQDTQEEYDSIPDTEMEEMLRHAAEMASGLSDADLAGWLDKTKALTSRIGQLPRDSFDLHAYRLADLVTTLWVSDLPHEVTHGTLEDVVAFAGSGVSVKMAPIFFSKVRRIMRLPGILGLPILVAEPASYQRSRRRQHGIDAMNPDAPPWCSVASLQEGEAYIEDGNHRAVARLLSSRDPTLEVIRFRLPMDMR